MARTGRPRSFDRSAAIDQAMRLFWAQGYEASSLAMLKDAMGGISAPSFYAAFGSKEALFEEVLTRYAGTYGLVTASLHDVDLAPREAVEGTLRASARMQTDTSHPPGCLLVVSATTTPAEACGAQALLQRDRAATRRGFAACVRRALERGELPASTDARGASVMFDSFMRGLTVQARDGVRLPQMEAAISCLMQWWPTPDATRGTSGLRHDGAALAKGR
jgi:TetR/AcrR family transcriptional regulator, copper-responsive repressor